MLDTRSLLPYLLLHLGKESQPGRSRSLAQCTRTASYKSTGLLHIPKMIYSNSADHCTTKRQLWICCTVNKWPNTALFHLRSENIWLCKIIYASKYLKCTESPSESSSADTLVHLCKQHSYCLILRFFHTEYSCLTTSLKTQQSSSCSTALSGAPLLLNSTV